MAKSEVSFEEHMEALEDAVRRLESGEESLSDSLKVYETAVGHLKACHDLLEAAEEKVRVLSPEGEVEFEAGEEN